MNEKGIVTLGLNIDSSLQIVNNKVGLVPEVLFEQDLQTNAPITRKLEEGEINIGLNFDITLRILNNKLSLAPEVLFEQDVLTTAPLTRKPQNGEVTLGLQYDNTLAVNPQGQLGVKERILLPSNIAFTFDDPLHFELDPLDQVGGYVTMKYKDEDFNLNDEGFVGTVDLNLKGQGAMSVRSAEWELGETDLKLRVIKLDVSSQFQQTSGVLDIRSQGAGRVPFYQLSSGSATNSNFTFDSATTLSVPFIKLTQS